MGGFAIQPGGPHLDGGLPSLRAEAEQEGIRNVGALVDRWAAGTERFDRPGEKVLVAVAGGAVIGVGGLTRCPDRPEALRVRRFYVSPSWRRCGVARELAAQLLERAFHRTDQVTCNAGASDAAPLFWESMGFERTDSPGTTHVLRRSGSPVGSSELHQGTPDAG